MTVLRIVPLLHQFEHGLFVRPVQVGLANASGFVPQTFGHYVENTGDTDLVFLEMFKAPRFQDISLNDWLTHIPPEWVIEHLGISQQMLSAIPRANYAVLPA